MIKNKKPLQNEKTRGVFNSLPQESILESTTNLTPSNNKKFYKLINNY